MNKSELISELSIRTQMPLEASKKAVNVMLDIITDQLAGGDPLVLPGFGTFTTKYRPSKTGYNPRTHEEIEIKACTVPTFKAGKNLKEAVKRNTVS